MAKELERDLGLPWVLAISIGAMVGSGIFILPALAMKMAGPAVVLAYLLAGVLVLPAALSKAEMATAMPEAGGTYVYIERGMGPFSGPSPASAPGSPSRSRGRSRSSAGRLTSCSYSTCRPRRWPWALRAC